MSLVIQWNRRKRVDVQLATPQPPTPSNITGSGATLSWPAVSGASFYTLERSTDASSWSVVDTGSDLSFTDSGLSVSTLYYYRLQAHSLTADSDYSENTVLTLDTNNPPATPAAPTVDAFATTTVSLSWVPVATANAYLLERSVSPFTSWTTAYSGPNTSFVDSGLTATTVYHYRLSASNSDGSSSPSTETSVTTATPSSPPGTPAQPTATGITSNSVNIAWVAVSGATDYELQRRQTAPAGAGIPTAYSTIYGPGPNTSFLDSGLAASATYDFRVRALNSGGASSYSVVRTVTTSGVGQNVQPVSALYLRKNSGVATHPNFNTPDKVWKTANADNYIELIYQGGWGFIRGQYANPTTFLPLLRARKMKWICGVIQEASGGGVQPPTNDTVAETRATVREIRENAADVVVGIEGINEPNDNRGSGTTVSNWADITVNHQRAIWQEAKWNLMSVNGPIGSSPTAGSVPNPLRNVKVYGPSLHDIACENSYTANPPNDTGPRHWHQLLDLGILNLQDGAGFHCYPGAGIPLRGARNRTLINEGSLNNAEGGNVTGRLELMWSAYGDRYPSYTTEWGYHNALAQLDGHEPIDERGAGIYYPRGYIQMLTQPFRINGTGLNNNTACTGFEFLDDQENGSAVNYPEVDGGTGSSNKKAQELNFGIYGYTNGTDATVPANWRPKPAYTKTKALLTHWGLEPLDMADYTPARVFCQVTTSATNDLLEWQLFSSKAQSDAGTSTVCIYRRNRVWTRGTSGQNPTTGVPVSVPTIPVTITDRVGPRTIQVGADVEYLDLR